jgi:hypothetical protein
VIAELAARYDGVLPKPLAVPVAWYVQAREGLCAAGMSVEDAEERLEDVLAGAEPHSAAELYERAGEGG